MKQYNEQVADNPTVEMIHVSLDNDEDAAEAWAAKEGFPWPTVMRGKVDRAGFDTYLEGGIGIPNYKLVDKDGKVIVEGKAAVFQKVAELKGDEA